MKLIPPPHLPPINTGMERSMALQLPFRLTDLLWRYPFSMPHPSQPPSSPLMDFKNHLPASLPSDPRIWSREDVATFLKWCEREFDLPNFDMEMFQMNGKALCLLTKNDLGQRCPGVGDVLHNILQMLVRDSSLLSRCLPSSPITPTSRAPYPLSPHAQPPTSSWNFINPPTDETSLQQAKHAANLAHFMNQGNSVTLSPAPSLDSQGSPQHVEHGAAANYVQTLYGNGASAVSSGSNHSDSDEDSYQENSNQVAPATSAHGTPPTTPSYNMAQLCLLPPPQPRSPKQIPATIPHASTPTPPTPTSQSHPSTPSYSSQPSTPVGSSVYKDMPRQFFPNDMPEPNTNGRLLWDFLQQLLNDPSQRYTNYITWKNQESGVFKIVDPAGLAKLWGIQKNHLSMNYDKMSRALRYYYRVNILRKVQGERHCYQFLRNPTELKSIKNISLLRQQMSPTRTPAQSSTSATQNQPSPLPAAVKAEPTKTEYEPGYQYYLWSQNNQEDEMPTDLSMPASEPSTPTDLRKPSDSSHPSEVGSPSSSELHSRKRTPHHLSSEHPISSPKSPKQMSFSDKHRISMIVGENLQKLSREREQHYASLNMKLEENPSAMIAT